MTKMFQNPEPTNIYLTACYKMRFWALLILQLLILSGCVVTQVPVDSTKLRNNLYLNINVHDPSMIEHNGRYYMFHTGRGIANWVSRDKENWIRLDPVFDSLPGWTQNVVHGFENIIYAPDIYTHNGTYYLYYYLTSSDGNDSAIGLVTNQTLKPDDPEYEWKDHGIVIQSIQEHNAKDPNLTFDENASPWLAFSTRGMNIKLVQLENDLKTAATTTEGYELHTIAGCECNSKTDKPDGSNVAAPFIFRKDRYYYLFVSSDRCCRGENCEHKVVVGRSDVITGPYLDKAGKRMDSGGGSPVVKGNGENSAVGHNSVYTFGDKDYLVGHANDINDGGRTKLVILEVTWDEQSWPVVDHGRREF